MTKVDLVKQWKEAARRDDLFDHMVPSDVRQLIGEIEQLRQRLDRFKVGYRNRSDECIRLRKNIKANQESLLSTKILYEG